MKKRKLFYNVLSVLQLQTTVLLFVGILKAKCNINLILTNSHYIIYWHWSSYIKPQLTIAY